MAKDKLSKGQRNFINQFVNADGKLSEEKMVIRRNIFTDEGVELNEVAAKCIDMIFEMEEAISQRNERRLKAIHPDLKLTNAIQKFDMARMTVLAFSSSAYMTLLD